jgi:sugar lactone lactonase YvrE
MVVDQQGRAYVGNFGSDIEQPGAKPSPASLALIHPDGTVESAAENILFPNGAVISADGKLLIIAETFGLRLTAFDVATDGTLSNRRVWADTAPHYPDGICQDDEGGVWIADPVNNCVVRFVEGGDITDKIDTGYPSYACMLGGDDRQRLFICTAKASGTAAAESRSGKIEYIDVAYRGVGQP